MPTFYNSVDWSEIWFVLIIIIRWMKLEVNSFRLSSRSLLRIKFTSELENMANPNWYNIHIYLLDNLITKKNCFLAEHLVEVIFRL